MPKPDPLVVGEGLRSVQHALDRQKKGVSAAKIVVDSIQSDGSSVGPISLVDEPVRARLQH